MVGMSGLLAGTLIMMMTSEKSLTLVFLGIVVLTGLVATSRLYLKAHTPKELYVGFLIGISGQMLAFSIYNRVISQMG
jgi:membrane-associated phospholipid phosphatase